MSPAVADSTWRALLAQATDALGERQAARWLVEDAAGCDAAGLHTLLDEVAPDVAATRLRALVARRCGGEPLQHVLGRWPFAGVELIVDRRALVPRPETEVLVDAALREFERLQSATPLVADLGTGSGAIAAALVCARADCTVVAVERDAGACSLAADNRSRLGPLARERLILRQGSWYGPLAAEAGALDLVVANPPYLAAGEWAGLDPVVRDHDPYDALVAGPTGLEAVAAVVSGAPAHLRRPGTLLCELAPAQAAAATALARRAGAREIWVLADLAGRERILGARW